MILLMLLAFVLLFFGGQALVAGASELSEKVGLSRAFVGLVVVSLGTSAPELAFGIDSALSDHGGLVAGNVMGSNIVNIGLTLGLAWVISAMPSSVLVHWRDILMMLGITALGVFLIQDGLVSRSEGVILVLVAALVILIGYRDALKTRDASFSQETENKQAESESPLTIPLVKLVLGIVILVVGAELLVISAVSLAEQWGVSEAIISLTLTAFGTGIPEVVATAMAALKKEYELAIGNIVGSNIMNIALVMGSSALVKPLSQVDIGWLATLVVLVATAGLAIMLKLRFTNRWAGSILLTGYAAYLFLLFQ